MYWDRFDICAAREIYRQLAVNSCGLKSTGTT